MAKITSILVLDDQENIRFDLTHYLKLKKFKVFPTYSVEKAKIIVSNYKIDFAIVDLKLDYDSDYGGIEAINFIKYKQPSSKIIILSAYSITDEFKNLNQVNYDAYVSKGGAENYLIAILKELKKYVIINNK